jgi:hypothetical protein
LTAIDTRPNETAPFQIARIAPSFMPLFLGFSAAGQLSAALIKDCISGTPA